MKRLFGQSTSTGFCVAMLRPGAERHEVIRPEQQPVDGLPFYELGTVARIVDFGQRDNGLLAITIAGVQRLQLHEPWQEKSGLWMAQAEPRPEPADKEPVQDLHEWAALLVRLLAMSGLSKQGIEPDLTNATEVLNNLVMLLPLPSALKQSILGADSQAERWQILGQAMTWLATQQGRQAPQ